MKHLILLFIALLHVSVMMADDQTMVIKDRDGRTHTINVSDLDSVYFSDEQYPEETNILYEKEEVIPPVQPVATNWYDGKRLLVIGDSQSAFPTDPWQGVVAEKLNMKLRTHAKDGIGVLNMVIGDGSGQAPQGFDPDNHDSNATLYALDTADVRDVDVIIIMGLYNMTFCFYPEDHIGVNTDIFPWSDSFKGQLNYALETIHNLLVKTRNWDCKVIIVSPHCFGKSMHYDRSGLDDGDAMTKAMKEIAEYQHVKFIDLMHSGVVTPETWNIYQNESSPYSRYYSPYGGGENDGVNRPYPTLADAPTDISMRGKFITVEGEPNCYYFNGQWWMPANYACIWNSDQLHLNKAGRQVVGEYIAKEMEKMTW